MLNEIRLGNFDMDDLPDFAALDAAYERQLFGPLARLASAKIENRPTRVCSERFGKPPIRQWAEGERPAARKWQRAVRYLAI
jgi:hypothetical protein